MKIIVLFLVTVQFLNLTHGGNILMIQLIPFSSYTNIMKAIINTLAPYHQITLFSVVHKEFNHPNVTLHPIIKPFLHIVSFEDLFSMLADNKRFEVVKYTLLSSTDEYMENLLKINTNLRDMLESKKKFDLFFTYSHISEHLYPISHLVQAPLVLVSPSAALPWQNTAIGNPNFFSYDYNLIVQANTDNFLNRIINYIEHFTLTFSYNWFYFPRLNDACQRIYPNGTPSLTEIHNNASLLIVNTHDAMGFSRPSISNSIQIGGIHCKPPRPLPRDLEEFIQGAGEHGVIYFSWGTTIQAKVPKEVTISLLNTFKKIPQRILWKWNDNIENLPDNIKMAKWFPQQDILGHKKVKLFISHGGMLSLQEAVYHGVPIFVIPITFDQPTNAILAEKLGYGRFIKFNAITEELLTNEINEILTNKQYKEKVQSLSTLMKDQPLSPGDRLKWWTDYIIRHKGYPIFKPQDNRYSWMSIIETDILAVFLLAVLLFVVFIIFLIRSVRRMIRNCRSCNKKIKKS